ncbi:aspartate 4-decarboxylase [Chitinophaga terrae (ex Kim and Jung 2007)]|uniref:Aspartate 4-decarboxylase n=1 Tax=Chitinophaga terrae (ex Kim and Jung 2007) TaxID=408074 RepID=A0A1H3X973_9BACT|nr:aspartate 4-decarboxylase [Chitinophaga terrae (ex Kim and Jung 2007)]GEP89853.1 aspartate 4-decarboxylase [Chitinophaga terrae (ex Kim and Jung 2007)]SDZ95823.1 aspartate 4-decarboxylase [Chitinophaga terrae (ex Kim and Jung 2007)]
MSLSYIQTTPAEQKALQKLSPFELKDTLISLAQTRAEKSTEIMLNAGRGNPNWTASVPREAFFLLGQFAITECKRNMYDAEGLAGVPERSGIGERFKSFLALHKEAPGAALLQQTYLYGIQQHNFNEDEYIFELAEAVMGNEYPVPPRMLKHIETVVHDYIIQEMCNNDKGTGKFDLFAVEGGTAAMCYIFDSLIENKLVKPGDKIALMVPVFTPYLEIPQLDRYKFDVVYIHAVGHNTDGRHTWQYPDEELEKLGDPKIRVLFAVNPSNPPSRAIAPEGMAKIAGIVKKHNPHLMIVTDDVYGTFVNNFHSLMSKLPANTICVYSFSKYFGCTGWRLGVITVHEHNIFDKMLAELPAAARKDLAKRYSSLTLHPERLKFIDRLVADSRQVALNHTAGLSTPQQTQMFLFSMFALLDKENNYKQTAQALIHKRLKLLWDQIELTQMQDPLNTGYYSEVDIALWAEKIYGEDFLKWLKKKMQPTDILFRLAEKTAIVLLNGGGFAGPDWSVRVSLANLPTESYKLIGESMTEIMHEYVSAYKEETGKK